MPMKYPASEYGEYYNSKGRRVRFPTRLFDDFTAYDVSRASDGALQRTPTRVLRKGRESIAFSHSYRGPDLRNSPEKDREGAVEYDGGLHSAEYVRSKQMERTALDRIDAELRRRRDSELRKE